MASIGTKNIHIEIHFSLMRIYQHSRRVFMPWYKDFAFAAHKHT